MGLKITLSAFLALGLSASLMADDALDALDKNTSDAIHSACHGYAIDMLPDLLSSARDWLNETSPICKDLRAQGTDYDVDATLKRHRVAFTAEDSKRIDAVYQAWKNKDLNLQVECQSEYMCMRIRKDLEQKKIPIGQRQYQQVADYCEQQPSPYGCLQDWFRDEWIAKGTRKLPSAQQARVSTLDFDKLMKDTPSAKQKKTGGALGFEQLMSSDSSQSAVGGSLAEQQSGTSGEQGIGFGDIYSGRSEHKLSESQAALKAKNQRIAGRCQCAQNGASCFATSSYKIEQLNDAMRQADENYEAQQQQVCSQWADNLRGRSADNEMGLAGLHGNVDVVLANLDKLSGNYKEITAGLQQKQIEVDRAVQRQQQAAEDEMFGKALAIGLTGLVAAGSGLPADQAAEVFSSVSQNILNDGNGADIMAMTQNIQLQELNLPAGALSSGSTGGASSSLTLTCKMPGVCAEYRFSSRSDRNNFAKRCAQVVQGSCPAGPSCAQTAGGRSVTTYSYQKSPAHVKRACEQGQGVFSG